ncbi:Tpr family protein [Theileria parva strain Muguga]|uniref:Uncharacterized protein n=1 Tax=Theileria parva TaxID=5875 RepID=Q4MZF7_THEPA|nr:uncharacterized protein TpMuguga_03g00563 [Theileria parva strain Muguga]EAN31308.1 Tpr family protein [Theileria parva strain Muguga]|eukprot:XP_763591.1 hypothetical protein [Theileria parva strain Muguga]
MTDTGTAKACGVLSAGLGVVLVALMNRLSKFWLITLLLLLSVLVIALITLIVVDAVQKPDQDHSDATNCPKRKKFGDNPKCPLLMAAFPLAGFAMMLNIRLCYSTAPYALMRFRLPENLFSVFVRRMATSLEIWCLPGFVIGDALDHIVQAEATIKKDSDSQGTGNPEFKRWKLYAIIWPSILAQWLNFLSYVILLLVYVPGEQGHLTTFYYVIAVSGFVFGISNPLVFACDTSYLPIYIAGENCFPVMTSLIHYLGTLLFGNRRKWNSDFIIVYIDLVVAIIISLVAAVLWTVGYLILELTETATQDPSEMKHIHPFTFGSENPSGDQLSPVLMIIVGMGLVYMVYPAIAPGMIVPFYLVDKIEMFILIASIVPPVIQAILIKHKSEWSVKYYKYNSGGFQKWSQYGAGNFYHFLVTLAPLQICLAIIFVYSLHHRESNVARSIINQPKMSTFLTILFYMCHECMLALGFSGFIGNKGGDLILIPQYIGALIMIFGAMYSEGYIIEYNKL